MDEVDLIVIGSGQGGVPFAVDMARQGKDVVLFERADWGGSCINYGCTPSKMLLASAHAVTHARRADELGIRAQVRVDFPAVMERIRRVTREWSQSVRRRLEEAGVCVVHAEAAFVDTRTVRGGDVTAQAPVVVINTGKSPRVPPIEGVEGTPYMTYKNFWEMTELPPRLVVLGAGFVGVELGQAMAQLGSEVTMIEVHERPIPKASLKVSQTLGKVMWERDGIAFQFNATTQKVEHAGGLFTVTIESGERFESEALLLSTGRQANTGALNAAASGVELDDRGHVKVDDHFRTTCDGVYAIGDVTGQPAFTHVSWEDHRRLQAILNGEEREQRDRVLSYAFFTDPQIGRTGLSPEQAQKDGRDVRVASLDLNEVARAQETGQTTGFYEMVVDAETGEILGATLVSPTAADLIHVFVAHIQSGSTWETLANSVHIHPTWAEGLPTLARLFEERPESRTMGPES